jgi:hypothetical protein
MIRVYRRGSLFKTNYNHWALKSCKVNLLEKFIVSKLIFSSQLIYPFFLAQVCVFQWKLKKFKMFVTPFLLNFKIGMFFLTKKYFLHLHRSKKKKNMTEKNKKKYTKRKSRLAWKRRNVKKRTISNHVFLNRSSFRISKNLRTSRIYNTPKINVAKLKQLTLKKKLSK